MPLTLEFAGTHKVVNSAFPPITTSLDKENAFQSIPFGQEFYRLIKKRTKGPMRRNYADIFRDYYRTTDKTLRRPTPLGWWAHGGTEIFGCCRGLIRQSIQSKLLNNDNYKDFISVISPITSSAKLELRKEII